MFHRVQPARLQRVLFLSVLTAVGCTRQPASSGDEAAAREDEAAARETGVAADTGPSDPVVVSSRQSKLLIELPLGCNTPDAMALLPDGGIVLSVPNFNNLEEGDHQDKIIIANQRGKGASAEDVSVRSPREENQGGRAEEHQGGRDQARPRHTPHSQARP